jgi:hypothetical protein
VKCDHWKVTPLLSPDNASVSLNLSGYRGSEAFVSLDREQTRSLGRDLIEAADWLDGKDADRPRPTRLGTSTRPDERKVGDVVTWDGEAYYLDPRLDVAGVHYLYVDKLGGPYWLQIEQA